MIPVKNYHKDYCDWCKAKIGFVAYDVGSESVCIPCWTKHKVKVKKSYNDHPTFAQWIATLESNRKMGLRYTIDDFSFRPHRIVKIWSCENCGTGYNQSKSNRNMCESCDAGFLIAQSFSFSG